MAWHLTRIRSSKITGGDFPVRRYCLAPLCRMKPCFAPYLGRRKKGSMNLENLWAGKMEKRLRGQILRVIEEWVSSLF